MKFPGMICNAEAEVKLRDRLFCRVLKTQRHSIRYLYDSPTVAYTQLLVAARNAEAEVSDGKLGTMTIKAKAATANDELVSLKQQVSDLIAVVQANHVWGNPKGTTRQNGPQNRNQTNRRTQIFGGTNQQSGTTKPSKNNQSIWQCYHCWGWGHMAKECATPLNYLKGEFQCSFPQNKRTKKAGSSTDPTQTDPITLKAIRKHYHNPDPIAHLVGKVNEACILIDDVECLALVDSGTQISTITIEFVKQLGLKIIINKY